MKTFTTILFISLIKLSVMAKEIKTEIIINAPIEKVWATLMDFENYSKWNTFITSIEGKAEVGQKLKAFLQPPSAKGMTFKPKVLIVNPKQEFRWVGHLLFPGIFDGQHNFKLVDNGDNTTTFIQSENFKGVLVPFLKKMIEVNTVQGFQQMNEDLKKEVENGGKN